MCKLLSADDVVVHRGISDNGDSGECWAYWLQ